MYHNLLIKIAICGLLLPAVPLPAVAAEAEASTTETSTAGQAWSRGKDLWTLHFENDALGVSDSDKHYTNGLMLSWQSGSPRLWDWLDDWVRGGFMFDEDTALHGRIAVGQNLFTPEDIKSVELVEDDRPYAGWLHVDFAVLGCNDRTLDVLEFSIGVVGPAAKGEEVQKWFHEVIGSPDPKGWHNQIDDELALMVAYGRRWRNVFAPAKAPLLGSLGAQIDVAPHVDMAFGNVYTYGGAGMILRLGSGLNQDFGPPRIRPAPPGAGFNLPGGHKGFYIFAGLSGRAMLHNIFLDGNTFKDSHSVEREVWVGDFHWGLVLTGYDLRLALSYVTRSREFVGQKTSDHFGAITFSASF